MRPTLALTLLALIAAAPAFAGEVYKWTDDKGHVQYTDAPPEGREFIKMKTGTQRPPTAVVEPAASTPTAVESEPVAVQGSAQANCAAARKNVENSEKVPEVSMDRDGDGKPETLTAEQRTAELQRNKGLVEIYCAPEAEPAR